MDIFGHHIEFAHPEFWSYWWLWAGFAVVVCAVAFLNLLAGRHSYAHPDNLNRTTRALSVVGAAIRAALYGSIAVLVCLAAAEPFEPNAATRVPEGTIHMVGAIDVSNSMGSEDYRESLPTEKAADGTSIKPIGPWGSRLHMAEWLFTEQVMKAMPGNKIGLATYCSEPWPQAPLCEDYRTLRFMLTDTGWIGIGSAPGDGSDFIQGLKIAIYTLRRDYDPKMRQMVVLFSDGGMDADGGDKNGGGGGGEESSFKDKLNEGKDEVAGFIPSSQIPFDTNVSPVADASGAPKAPEGKAKVYADVIAELKALNAEVLIVGLGSDIPQLVPIYGIVDDNGRREIKRVDWFPFGQQKKEKTALNEANLITLRDRLNGAGVKATYVRVPTKGEAALGVDWVAAVGGSKMTTGKKQLTQYPVAAAMLIGSLLMLRALFRRSDIVRTSAHS